MSVAENLRLVLQKIQDKLLSLKASGPVRLVAVSKTKPVSDILEAYNCNHRHFGENYINELCEKAVQLPQDVNWHYIGALQSNKFKQLASIPNLWAIETLESVKHAQLLNKVFQRIIRVFVQVNTSNEETKNGLHNTEQVMELVRFILSDCPNLVFVGLMTIGSPRDDPRIDFQRLIVIKRALESELHLKDLELSMGMSSDYEIAVFIVDLD